MIIYFIKIVLMEHIGERIIRFINSVLIIDLKELFLSSYYFAIKNMISL